MCCVCVCVCVCAVPPASPPHRPSPDVSGTEQSDASDGEDALYAFMRHDAVPFAFALAVSPYPPLPLVLYVRARTRVAGGRAAAVGWQRE